MLLAMFSEIEQETGVRLYDAASDDGVGAGEAILPAFDFPPTKSGGYVYGREAMGLKVAELVQGCDRGQQRNVVGLDCEWEPSLGGKTPNPVATIQLSLPDGTAALFHLQRGNQKAAFPQPLRDFLEDPSVAKVRADLAATCAKSAIQSDINNIGCRCFRIS